MQFPLMLNVQKNGMSTPEMNFKIAWFVLVAQLGDIIRYIRRINNRREKGNSVISGLSESEI